MNETPVEGEDLDTNGTDGDVEDEDGDHILTIPKKRKKRELPLSVTTPRNWGMSLLSIKRSRITHYSQNHHTGKFLLWSSLHASNGLSTNGC